MHAYRLLASWSGDCELESCVVGDDGSSIRLVRNVKSPNAKIVLSLHSGKSCVCVLCAHICAYICVCVCVCVCSYYINICIHLYLYIDVQVQDTRMYLCTHTEAYLLVGVLASVPTVEVSHKRKILGVRSCSTILNVSINTIYIYIYTHTHAYMHTQHKCSLYILYRYMSCMSNFTYTCARICSIYIVRSGCS